MTDARAELETGRACYRRRAWSDAYRALSAADRAAPLAGEDLWLLALSAYLIGRDDEFLAVLERAHHTYIDAGETVAAVRCAFWVGFRLAARAEIGRATGWFARSARLLESAAQDCVERGFMLLPAAYQQLLADDFDAAHATAVAAAGIAERFHDADLLALALQLQGRALLGQTRIDAGLALLDEAMVAVASGELSPHVTGLIYCNVIGACRNVYALRRVQEWTAALTDWCEQQPDLLAYTGECLVYRAEILQLHGAWPAAIDEARKACERFARRVDPQPAGAAFYQQAEVHRLLGEFAAAEEAYRSASQSGRDAQPGLALLRLAQGSDDAAAAAIRRVVDETGDPLQRARLLPAHIEIMLTVGDLDEARRACRALEETARVVGGSVLGIMVAQAEGAIALAQGDARTAIVPLRQAWQGWQALDAPYEAARVRVLLGLACRALGDDETAALELDAARTTFENLGAAPDLRRVDALTRGSRARHPHGLTARERQVLALVATGRTNRAIAAQLVISEKTVARHVSNIFSKLGLSSRSAATAYAYEHDLL
jgi:DNA-binding CsgD family transcriptional regulator